MLTKTSESTFDALRPTAGSIDVIAVQDLSGLVTDAAASALRAANAIKNVDRTPLIGVVSAGVDQVDATLQKLAGTLDSVSRSTQLLPQMLGKDGDRTYLLLVQNNAEWRSLGGITGSTMLLRARHGSFSLATAEPASSLSSGVTAPLVRLPDDALDIYGAAPAVYFQNLTQLPDFTVGGRIARDMYRVRTGVQVDGVIVIDPIALSYLLQASGPVRLPDGEQLTSRNAPGLLMNEVYLRYKNPADQDAFFSSAAQSIFSSFLNGGGDTASTLSAISRAVNERRILVWSADSAEQALIAGTPLAGELPSSDSRTSRFGVFLNDGTGSKMSYYVKPDVQLSWGQCGGGLGDTPHELTLTLTLTNTAPTDAERTLPPYITGNGAYGIAPGSVSIVPNLYLPPGYQVASSTTSDGTSFVPGALEGRTVLTYGFVVQPQSSVSLTVVVQARTSASKAEAFVTPTADTTLNPTVAAECERVPAATLE
ncbi:DUF4012 domain-containing protein [Microbacterium sp. PRF11]|uniref:DUF4012 domain-containing protein n=1 Tax=Microbacterium sp. PRF11 TaxID=2962593 RepID=UPI002881B6C6|nr:DUF4012 domain-containing protein [Microbacterium sp. PRF11]MDT0117726.1 DUF4012 domain-containing protein [Microbacterium sp. PRF11]